MKNKVTILNCPISLINSENLLNYVSNAIEDNKNLHIITINPEMIINAQKNSGFMEIIRNADFNIPDGVGVKIALKLKNISQSRIRGIDFSRSLIELASKNNYRVALIGAKEEVINKTKENILDKYSNINIIYARNGYFADDDLVVRELKNLCPQIVLVGLGSPRQEEFIAKLKNNLNGCTMVGVGGSFDVFSGNVKESPVIFRKLGLEWLYRTILQPERFKRIFPVLPIFLIKCIIDIKES